MPHISTPARPVLSVVCLIQLAGRRCQAFYGALHLELDEYRSCLEFKYEHQLTTEPLRIGALIIKKKPETVIRKNIGAIFRQENVIEFKYGLSVPLFYQSLIWLAVPDTTTELPNSF